MPARPPPPPSSTDHRALSRRSDAFCAEVGVHSIGLGEPLCEEVRFKDPYPRASRRARRQMLVNAQESARRQLVGMINNQETGCKVFTSVEHGDVGKRCKEEVVYDDYVYDPSYPQGETDRVNTCQEACRADDDCYAIFYRPGGNFCSKCVGPHPDGPAEGYDLDDWTNSCGPIVVIGCDCFVGGGCSDRHPRGACGRAMTASGWGALR